MGKLAQDDGRAAFSVASSSSFPSGSAIECSEVRAAAEELVQDVWMRWQSHIARRVQDAPAYPATIPIGEKKKTRLAGKRVQIARVALESYFGNWSGALGGSAVDTASGLQGWGAGETRESF